jgi:hypothetical protein
MDAAGPVDGANERAAHEVLGNRCAIPTASTAQTDCLSTTEGVTINPSTKSGELHDRPKQEVPDERQ